MNTTDSPIQLLNQQKTIQPFHIDGALYFGIAFFGVLGTALGGNEAYDLLTAAQLFWAKTACAAIAAGCLALKTFRSTTYAASLTEPKVLEDLPPIKSPAPAPAPAPALPQN